MLPLSLASLDVAQANSAVIGLLLMAAAAAKHERWMLSAGAISVATYLKIYPLAFGLLLCIYEPRRMTWRLVLMLALFGLFSLALQNPHYVIGQYQDWIRTRTADDRRLYSMRHAPLDLWYLLVRIGHLPLSEHLYEAVQVLSGAAAAIYCLRAARNGAIEAIILLCSCWMILLGPATESYTYAIFAPAVCLGLVSAHRSQTRFGWLASLAFAILLGAQLKATLFSAWHSELFNGLRPLGALAFTGFAILWLRGRRAEHEEEAVLPKYFDHEEAEPS